MKMSQRKRWKAVVVGLVSTPQHISPPGGGARHFNLARTVAPSRNT
jgi:hypothetical protein